MGRKIYLDANPGQAGGWEGSGWRGEAGNRAGEISNSQREKFLTDNGSFMRMASPASIAWKTQAVVLIEANVYPGSDQLKLERADFFFFKSQQFVIWKRLPLCLSIVCQNLDIKFLEAKKPTIHATFLPVPSNKVTIISSVGAWMAALWIICGEY